MLITDRLGLVGEAAILAQLHRAHLCLVALLGLHGAQNVGRADLGAAHTEVTSLENRVDVGGVIMFAVRFREKPDRAHIARILTAIAADATRQKGLLLHRARRPDQSGGRRVLRDGNGAGVGDVVAQFVRRDDGGGEAERGGRGCHQIFERRTPRDLLHTRLVFTRIAWG